MTKDKKGNGRHVSVRRREERERERNDRNVKRVSSKQIMTKYPEYFTDADPDADSFCLL